MIMEKIIVSLELPVTEEMYKAITVDDYSTEDIKLFSEREKGEVKYRIVLHSRKIGEVKGIINEVLRIIQMLEDIQASGE